MLIFHAAMIEEAHVESRSTAELDTPDIQSAKQRADEEPGGPKIWYVEERADEEPGEPKIWYVEKRADEGAGIWYVEERAAGDGESKQLKRTNFPTLQL